MEWVAVVQQLDADLLAIELARSGIYRQMQSVSSIPLFKPDSGAPVSKDDFKEIGAAGLIVSRCSVEATVALVANAIETFSIRLKRHMGIEWESFKAPRNDCRFSSRPKQFRAINNVFKHQEGYVEAANSKSARFLVEAGHFSDLTYLKNLPPDHIVPDIELALYETFCHLYELVFKAEGLPMRSDGLVGNSLVTSIRQRVIPEVVEPYLLQK